MEHEEYRVRFARWVKEQEDPAMLGVYSIQIAGSAAVNSDDFKFLSPEDAPGIYIFEGGGAGLMPLEKCSAKQSKNTGAVPVF